MSLHCTWRDMLREAVARLSAAGIDGAHRDARLLLADALDVDAAQVIAREMDQIDGGALASFEASVKRRLAGEPVSRIRGWREFYGRRFAITPDVLDPRPETELLVEQGVKRLPGSGRVLDLGTGSGCILVSVLAERPDATGVAVDVSPAALKIAKANALALGVADRAAFIEGSWGAASGAFDLVLSNPPYVAEAEFAALDREVRGHDPKIALVGGDGLTACRAIAGLAPDLMMPGGWLGLEVGRGQSVDVQAILAAAGFGEFAVFEDLAGIPRAVFGRWPG